MTSKGKEILVIIVAAQGLHARPSARIAQTIEKYRAEVYLTYQKRQVPATSMLEIMSLCIPEGAKVSFCASGENAAEVLTALKDLPDIMKHI